ncbi:sigma-70 family RNA polymerase sigma factor [Fulvivirgaceae bacterium BMA10]|uniref:Sigma-70 family RNA polymerase sigma factor n=1 Tax=Splendidivirga corallicola TaxID=3051826 RepID=A0ABT8KU02_9BACT|nr:sigma-70 family RNA polymerase sigma factor [Fulvivirgaceae bacterium BMA10]
MELNSLFSVQNSEELDSLKKDLSIELTDVELWNLIRKDDSEAMIKLYKRHYHILYSYGMKICRSKELTKDCIQEIFTNIWASRRTLNKVKIVRSYLLQTLWNKLVGELKKNSKRNDIIQKQVYQSDIIFSHEDKLIDEENESELMKRLSNSISSLSKSQKEMIFMLFYEGLSYKQIAEKKSVNYQSVKNLSHKTIKKLRELIIMYALTSFLLFF